MGKITFEPKNAIQSYSYIASEKAQHFKSYIEIIEREEQSIDICFYDKDKSNKCIIFSLTNEDAKLFCNIISVMANNSC